MQLKNLLVEKRLNIVFKTGIFLILALPLFSFRPYFHPSDWGQSIIFRIIFSAMLFLFAWLAVLNKEKRNEIIFAVKKNIIIQLMLALAGVYFIAVIFSLDPFFSFWGSPLRGDGYLNFALYILFGIFCFLNVKKSDWEKLWNFAFFIGILVCLVGVAQKFNWFKSFLSSYDRVMSTAGSPMVLGLYLTLLFFVAFALALKNRGKISIYYYFCSLLFLFVLGLTGNRAVFLGAGVAVLYFALFYRLKKSPEEKFTNKIFWLKIVIVLLIIAGIAGIILAKDNQKIIDSLSKNPLGEIFYRVLVTAQAVQKTGSLMPDTRSSAWNIALLAIKDRPILGYGPENFSIAFDSHFDPKFEKFGRLFWWDRAHNIFLESAVNAGIFGFLIYISLAICLFWVLQKLKKKKPEDYHIFHGMQAALAGYFIAGFFSFDGFPSFIIFYFLAGYCAFCWFEKQENKQKNYSAIVEKNYYKDIFFVSLILLLWFLWAGNLKPLIINKYINMAEYYAYNEDCQNAINQINLTVNERSIIENYAILNYMLRLNGGYCSQKIDAKEAMEKRVELLKKAIKIRPYYTRSFSILGRSFYALGQKNEADIARNKSIQLCPKCQENFVEASRSYISGKEYQLAKNMAEKCLEFSPDFTDCLWLRGISDIYMNNLAGGKKDIEACSKFGYPGNNYGLLTELLNAYLAVKDMKQNTEYYQDLADIYQKLIKIDATNYQYHVSLTAVYAKLGMFEEARKESDEILKYKPELKADVEQFLKTMK